MKLKKRFPGVTAGRWIWRLMAAVGGGMAAMAATGAVQLASPDGRVKLGVTTTEGRLEYHVAFRGAPVIEPSPLGILVDGVDLGRAADIDEVEREQANEKYPSRGVHSVAVNRYYGMKIRLRHAGVADCTVEARAFNDGVAFRFIVPPAGKPRIPGAATVFVLPARSRVWYYGLKSHYEGVYTRRDIGEVQEGEWAAPPLTFRLADGAGYASITEAALMDYAGMALQADGHRGFHERLGNEEPPSHDFLLRRNAAEEARRLARPAVIDGAIRTPWRVILVGADLNSLVNSDVIPDLCPPPDRELFPKGLDTNWLKPGRSVWRFMDGGGIELKDYKEFTRLAGELGFEYNLVEHWRNWTDDQIRELVDYSNRYNVRVLLWNNSSDLRNAGTRRRLFKRLHELGIAGVKVDFIDSEAKELVDFYQACLRDAAEFELVVDFHGANKPTGESRTWPNELTREAIYGLEQGTMPAWAQHNTTLPFTRFLAGPADYTPVMFGERRRETTWAHQIATAAIFTSPLLVYGAYPERILENPAVDLIKSIPSVWDETIVLPVSEIGTMAAFARRSSDTWFLAVLNGPESRNVRVSLSFLRQGPYRAMIVKDQQDNPAAVTVEHTTSGNGDSIPLSLRPGGGFIARFSK